MKIMAICPYCGRSSELKAVDDGAVACSYDCYESYLDEIESMSSSQFVSHLSEDY